MNLSLPIPVRLSEEQKRDLEEVTEFTGVDASKVIRLAVRAGLPAVRKQFGLPDDRKKKGGEA